MNLFLTTFIENGLAVLPEEESYHCIRVLRMKREDEIFFVDGQGGFYSGTIVEGDTKKCVIKIKEYKKESGKRSYRLHVVIAPTKSLDRFEWFLEKATEIGIDEITPVICQRSERREIKTERLNKVIIAAMKQSLKAYLPKLNNAVSFENLVAASKGENKFICNMNAEDALKKKYEGNQDALVLIGPEGDFTENEMSIAIRSGMIPANLGSSRLRTETAGIVACSIISLRN